MYCTKDEFLPNFRRSALGHPDLVSACGALRRPLPRRARRLDGRHGAALDPASSDSRPRSSSGWSPATCSATAGCCCSAAAPPTCSAVSASDRGAVGVRRRLGGRRPCERRHPARGHAHPEGHERGVHRAGRPLDHHHHVPEGPNRNRALAFYTATGASGFSLGLVLGGLLTELGWRWTFLLPVPFAIAILIVARNVIPRDRMIPGQKRRYDIAGAVTITAAMLLLVRTVVEAPEVGWSDPETIGAFALVLALLIAFVAVEQRAPQPLVRLGILRSGPLVRANLGMATMFGAYLGFQFIATLYLQTVHGWSPVETALAFLPGGLLVALGSPRIGPLIDRFGTARVIAVGTISFVIGYALFLRIDSSPTFVELMLPTMLLIGFGFALCFPAPEHPGGRRHPRPRAGPGFRPREHLAPARRGARAGDRHGRRGRRDDARRVPPRDRGRDWAVRARDARRVHRPDPQRARPPRPGRGLAPRGGRHPPPRCRTQCDRARRPRSPRPRGRRARAGSAEASGTSAGISRRRAPSRARRGRPRRGRPPSARARRSAQPACRWRRRRPRAASRRRS